MNGFLRAGALALALMTVCASAPFAAPFPELPGFVKQDEARTYDPDNLFEYINGDAFSYINFGFEEVAVQDYANENKQQLTIDIYRHSSDNNGFGIYSHERPADAKPLPIGGEAYYEEGILNFFKGPYYVKLRSDGPESLLKKVAAEVAEAIEGGAALPPTAAAFPEEQMLPNSLRYMGGGFLGHSFLHSAFVADYQQEEGKIQLFIIEGADSGAVEKMLKDYLALVERKEGSHTVEDGVYRFKDPYHSSRGMMNLKQAGIYLYGLFSDDRAAADSYLKMIEKRLLY